MEAFAAKYVLLKFLLLTVYHLFIRHLHYIFNEITNLVGGLKRWRTIQRGGGRYESATAPTQLKLLKMTSLFWGVQKVTPKNAPMFQMSRISPGLSYVFCIPTLHTPFIFLPLKFSCPLSFFCHQNFHVLCKSTG